MILIRVQGRVWPLVLDPSQHEWPRRVGWTEVEERMSIVQRTGRGRSHIYYTTPERLLLLADECERRAAEYGGRARERHDLVWLARQCRMEVELHRRGISQVVQASPRRTLAMIKRMRQRAALLEGDGDAEV